MLHPVGPLPPHVYWRRRALVVAGALVVLFVLRGLFFGGEGEPETIQNVSDDQTTTDSDTGEDQPDGDPSPSTTLTVSPGNAGGPAPAGGSGSSTPSDAAATPPTCDDSALTLTVASDKDTYQVGEQPLIRLVVANSSDQPCSRDVGAAQQEVLIFAGDDRLWSSNDCSPGGEPDVRVLQPGRDLQFSVRWPGRTSSPECERDGTAVEAGEYRLVGRLGSLEGAEDTFTLA